jgi:hypothetical protein
MDPDRRNSETGRRGKVLVQGPHNVDAEGHEEKLVAQLKNIPKDAQALFIDEDTPSDVEWSILGRHFTSVTDLEMESGWNEELNDKIPLYWPLERLHISSACSAVVKSPFILEGRVKHLILLLTSGLRFEGPTNDELSRKQNEDIARGDAEAECITANKGTPEERKIEVTYIPELVSRWFSEKYRLQSQASYPEDSLPTEIKLQKLEILENDAIDTFNRMFLALPHIVEQITTLNLRSTLGLDFHYTSEALFTQVLPQLTGIRTLVLSVADVSSLEIDSRPFYTAFPPDLTTLRFRGPISLYKAEQWDQWMGAFESPEFLPQLKKLSFVLDLNTKAKEDNPDKAQIETEEVEELRKAKRACDGIHAAARARGVSVEPFHDEWAGISLKQVDDRWEAL